MNPASSFLRFTLGFLLFISLSFVITFAMNSYVIAQDQEKQTAAAIEAMLK
ncbi:MAG: hypothetical protein HYS26_00035 [Candidatus Kaiserbacteria bacterium]|nr:MAG: hypothetical protein HYS26_00035 [Candidatus Kaiserbacteria bacterium]